MIHVRYPRHRRRWRSTNLLERSLGEVKRRSKASGRFPASTAAGLLPSTVDTSGRLGLWFTEGIVPGLGDLGGGSVVQPGVGSVVVVVNVVCISRGAWVDEAASRAGGRSSRVFGTIDYVAPEQIRDEDVDGRADVFRSAGLLYECLTCEPPFRRSTDAAPLFAHLEEEPPAPPGLEDVIPRAPPKETP